MAIYVTSDLHGLELEKLLALLDSAGFSEDDWLYILGDVVDRKNDGGVEILIWLLEQPNVQLILGNHEAMLLSCSFVFSEITDKNIELFTEDRLKLLDHYMNNGGEVTLATLKKLLSSSPETVADILTYLSEAPLYETVSVGGRDFLLVHAGLDNFDSRKRFEDYSAHDIIWNRPMLTDEYFEDIMTVFGHTPTMSYGEQYNGKILKMKTWIDIDVGVPYGNAPALLRLDDLKEFYL